MLLISNYINLHATLKRANNHFQNTVDYGNISFFLWTVQLYGFNLTFSNTFFLLLRRKQPADGGIIISSASFDITYDPSGSSSVTPIQLGIR